MNDVKTTSDNFNCMFVLIIVLKKHFHVAGQRKKYALKNT